MRVVSTGRDALQALDDEVFDIVLMDVQMPDMTGVETTQRIRRREHDIALGRAGSAGASFGRAPHPHLPIVAMTAHVMESDRDACLAAGMDAFLSKPIAASELLDDMARLRPQARVGNRSRYSGRACSRASRCCGRSGNTSITRRPVVSSSRSSGFHAPNVRRSGGC